MWNNMIGRHIQRANRNFLILGLVLFVTPLLAALVCQRYLYNFFKGPFSIRSETLHATTNPETLRQYYVKVQGEASVDTGGREVEQRRSKYSQTVESETVKAHFILLAVDKKLLLVKTNTEDQRTEYTGALVPIPSEVSNNILSQIQSDIAKEAPGAGDIILPYMLDATDFRTPGTIGLAIGLPTLLIGGWCLLRVRKSMGNLAGHPIARALETYGSPLDLAHSIDMETRTEAQKFGSIELTSSWAFRPTTFGLDLVRLDDVVWIYPKVVQHRTNFIPTGKSYAVILCDRQGKKMEFTCSEAQTQSIMQQIAQKRPWIIVGYDQQLEAAWQSDRAGLIQAVDARRQAGTQPVAPTPESQPYTPPPSAS